MSGRAASPSARSLLAAAVIVAAALALPRPAQAARPLWRLDSQSAPSYLMPGSEAKVIATASNLGGEAVLGSGAQPLVITDRLPANLRIPASGSTGVVGKLEASNRLEAASLLECSVLGAARREARCATTHSTQPATAFSQLRVTIPVEVLSQAASGEQNAVELSGGEPAASAQISRPLAVSGQATPFGVERYEMQAEEEDGEADAIAGSHPFQLTTTLNLTETLAPEGEGQAELEPSAPRSRGTCRSGCRRGFWATRSRSRSARTPSSRASAKTT